MPAHRDDSWSWIRGFVDLIVLGTEKTASFTQRREHRSVFAREATPIAQITAGLAVDFTNRAVYSRQTRRTTDVGQALIVYEGRDMVRTWRKRRPRQEPIEDQQ